MASNNSKLDRTHVSGLAAAQHGVISTAQLHALGYSDGQIHWRVRARRLHRLHRGVYAVGHTDLSLHGRWLAAVLACGAEALLSHRHAGALWELTPNPTGPIHVTAAHERRLPGIACHRSRSLSAADGGEVDGIPVTAVPRTLLDLAALLTRQRLRTVLEQAQRRDLLDGRKLDDLLARCGAHRGRGALQRALAELEEEPPWTQSELERWFLELSRDEGLPRAQTNVYVEGELVDAYFPEQRLVVEVDGWQTHRTRQAFENDRRRDALLQAAGYRVVRFTYRQLRYERRWVVVQLTTLLRSSAWARSGR